MAVRITYFVHGTTTDNESDIASGWNDVELSDLGRMQAENLRRETAHHHFDVVFCSDLKRAVDTANFAWRNVYEIIEDERLRECNYGVYNGKPSEEVEPLHETHTDTPMPNGESYEVVKERMESFLEELKQTHDGKHVALVAHRAPQLALDVILKGMSWEEAFKNDWRHTKAWQPGWEYRLN